MPDKAKCFEDLTVWQKTHSLVLNIYRITNGLPSEEKFGLVSQMRRSGVSIAANLAEGFKKRGIKDKANYYHIPQGSLEELRYYVILAKDLGHIEKTAGLSRDLDEVARMLYGLLKSISTR